ncbi:alpha/beta hydrolase [Paracidovorax wautersii]|uniref:Monoterpene epsilon-lactone hydrolase n=1 Tax=Paracidovorax wautersii TaxID=1177982 RepID=A0ABU1I5F6_9BURK|nr:alpha/beta hydrolase [Paracidovorax wautersii]MDR6212461.1 monoterpene epsilon-lactone hydrolase [Paracidovorax wautersii]
MSAQQLQSILQIAAQNPPPPLADLPRLRAWFDATNSQMPPADDLRITALRIPGAEGSTLDAEVLDTPGSDPTKLIIYFHAGGFLFGSLQSHRTLCSYLGQFSGARVLNVAYRLAPEHPAPTAHEDAFAAYQWALANGYAASAIALAGDSAGGNLALATAVRVRDRGLARPCAVVALSPGLDFTAEGESHRTVDDPFITQELMDLVVAGYAQGGDPRSEAMTPFYSALEGLPPVQLQVGSQERLRDDAETMAARLTSAGVDVECHVWPGMVHCWQLFAPLLDEAMASLEQAGRFIAARQRS